MSEATHPTSLPVPSQPAPRVRPSRAEYQKQRRRLLHDLYFKSEQEKEDLRALAEADGYGHDFNGWLLIRIHASLSGSLYAPEYVDGLNQQVDRLTRWHEGAREEAESYRAEVATLRQQKETLLFLLHELPGGSEVAARFLGQNAGVSA